MSVCEVLVRAAAAVDAEDNLCAVFLSVLQKTHTRLVSPRSFSHATPLHGAALNGHDDVCRFLVHAAADPLATTRCAPPPPRLQPSRCRPTKPTRRVAATGGRLCNGPFTTTSSTPLHICKASTPRNQRSALHKSPCSRGVGVQLSSFAPDCPRASESGSLEGGWSAGESSARGQSQLNASHTCSIFELKKA